MRASLCCFPFGISHLGEVMYRWSGVEYFHGSERTRILDPGIDRTVLVVHISENNRIRRTSLLTGCLEIAILDAGLFVFRLALRFIDSLNAEGTFLHDPA